MMYHNNKAIIAIFFLLFISIVVQNTTSCKIDLNSNKIEWKLCQSQNINNLKHISFNKFLNTTTYQDECFPAIVPGTALISMLNNNMFPGISDLFHDEDLNKIPDIYNNSGMYTFFWRAQIHNVTQLISKCNSNNNNNNNIPSISTLKSTAYVHIRSLNYRASFFQNGKEIMPINVNNNKAAVGMFHRWKYPINIDSSSMVSFAILISPPDYVGKPNCGQGGDHEIAKNAAIMQYTAGWDWARATPDRNTGLWDLVELEVFHDHIISLINPHIKIKTNITSNVPPSIVNIDIATSIFSQLNDNDDIRYILRATVMETMEHVETTPFKISSNNMNVKLPSLSMKSPKLWFPHTHYDGPNLYTMQLELFHYDEKSLLLIDKNLKTSPLTEMSIKFGIRTFTTYVDTDVTDGRVFLCNGEKIFIQGGNWIGTDQFLRYSTSSERYHNEILLHKQMGLNMIRVWGGGITERPEFYNAADELGMLIWQEFWMTGDNNGRWAGNYSSPLEHNVYLSCVQDVILMLRNHPSLLLWVGGNELYPEKLSPPKDLAIGIPLLISELDPGRFYIASSMSNYTNYDYEFAIAPKDGPYGYLDPRRFDERNPGLEFWNKTSATNLKLGFQPETGSSATPIYRSIKRFLHGENLKKFPKQNDDTIPSVFTFHQYLGYVDDQKQDHITKYGRPTNMSEYCYRAQLVQYCQVKGLYEGFQRHMWLYYTGMLFWKTQSPWPSFRGYMYDSYLETNGGFWGLVAATEGGKHGSLHVQLGNWTENLSIVVINRQYFDVNHFNNNNNNTGAIKLSFYLSVQWFHMNGTLVNSHDTIIADKELIGKSVYLVTDLDKFEFPVDATKSEDSTLYLRMELSIDTNSIDVATMTLPQKQGQVISFNDYWLSNPSTFQNYQELDGIRSNEEELIHLQVTCNNNISIGNNGNILVTIKNGKNNNQMIALAIRLNVILKSAAETLNLPYTYSKQYFTLLPNESTTVIVISSRDEEGNNNRSNDGKLQIQVEGWNVVKDVFSCVCDNDIV